LRIRDVAIAIPWKRPTSAAQLVAAVALMNPCRRGGAGTPVAAPSSEIVPMPNHFEKEGSQFATNPALAVGVVVGTIEPLSGLGARLPMRWLFPIYFSLSTAALVVLFVVHLLR